MIQTSSSFFMMLFVVFAFAQRPPNVILILTDDQGSVDLNCYGAKDLYTPNIDNLAKTGTRFTQFYAAAPLCSPSRSSMLTGLNPYAAGLPNNASSIPGHKGMPTEQITIAEAMKATGYVTGHIGKWHLGFSPETMPNAQGFDYSFGHMGGCIDNYSHFFYWNGPNRHDLYENGKEIWREGQYFPDLMAEKAEAFIEQNQNQPFFLYYAINLPHYPLQPASKWREYYKGLPQPRRDYAAFISTIDERIGRLLVLLDHLKLREQTLIIFQSDHGHSVEERAFGGGGNAGPYRGAKMSLFEGGIRVPAIISWPGKVPENTVRNQMALNIDWFPTIAAYCDIKTKNLEGKSLIPVINNASTSSAHDVFRWKQGVSWAIRKGDWKLMGYPRDPTHNGKLDPDKDLLFLTNVKLDPGEMNNLAGEYPEKVKLLIEAYLTWPYAKEEDIPQKQTNLKSKAKGKSIQLEIPPHQKYYAKGAESLIDEKLGTRLFSDGYWLGFEQRDVEATIDLGKIETIGSINIGVLQDASAWIFFPNYIEVSFSTNGRQYANLIRKDLEPLKDPYKKIINRILIQKENLSARYLKIKVKNVGECPDWHSARGQKAWLFVDEITIHD